MAIAMETPLMDHWRIPPVDQQELTVPPLAQQEDLFTRILCSSPLCSERHLGKAVLSPIHPHLSQIAESASSLQMPIAL